MKREAAMQQVASEASLVLVEIAPAAVPDCPAHFVKQLQSWSAHVY